MQKIAAMLYLLASAAVAQVDTLLPPGEYRQDIPTPESYLGYAVGSWHVRHDQLAGYMQALAAASDRMHIAEIGRTHEQRPILTLTVSSPANLAGIDQLRQTHLRGGPDGPLVLWFGYSIHGNEASGSNAALLFAYYLAASSDPAVAEALDNTVILLDPSLNPDGLGRFASWVNSHRSVAPLAPRANREHQEAWPGGRFNHYWFDLNRDWLPLVHPESRARVALQRRWRPHVLTDFHEMGSDSSYFFQPGVPDRRNPWTPLRNAQLTARLASFHAQAFDEIGQAYFSEETFDDFYYGKGSTYPDALGSIGILFEQASARGHLMATRRGELSLRTAVRNHLTTSLSTLRGATQLRSDLLDYRSWFDEATAKAGAAESNQAYVVGDAGDPERARVFIDILRQHEIELYELARPLTTDQAEFLPGKAWLIPVAQPGYRLIMSLFDERTEFEDNTFYDVSSWHLPHAFDLPYTPLRKAGNFKGKAWSATAPAEPPLAKDGAVAYAVAWNQYGAARTLGELLSEDLLVAAATRPFTARTPSGDKAFAEGTVIVNQSGDPRLLEILSASTAQITPIMSGLTPAGPDLGSESIAPLKAVKPVLLVGRGVSPSEVGEVWHLLDTRLGSAPVMIEARQLSTRLLSDYTHLLMVDGNYKSLDTAAIDSIRRFVHDGGILVATKRAAAWATTNQLHTTKSDDDTAVAIPAEKDPAEKSPEILSPRAYGNHADDAAKDVIGGAVVKATVDLTHPLAWGLSDPELALFRNGTVFLKPAENPYETPLRYADKPLLAGFMGQARRQQLAGSAAGSASRVGRGAVIRLADNPNFRGFWYGTNRLYFNALFMTQTLKSTAVADTDSRL